MAFEGFEEISRTINDALTTAGWDQTNRSKESRTPEFVSNNGQMRTSIFQSIRDESLMLTLVDIDSGAYIRFEVRYGKYLHALLSVLTEWHDRVTVDNFHDMVNEIALQVPEILAEPFEGDENTPWEKVVPRK